MPYLSVSAPVLSAASLPHQISDASAALLRHMSAVRDTIRSSHSESSDAKVLAIVV